MSIVTVSSISINSLVPYAHYKCNDDASSTTVTDDGAGNHDGTCSQNTDQWSVTGKINEAFDLDGSNVIEIDSLASAVNSDTIGTISLWIEITNNQSGYFFSFSDSSSSGGLDIFAIGCSGASPNKIIIYTYWGSGVQWQWYSAELSEGWHHFAVVQNGTSPKFYIDGTQDTTAFDVDNDATSWFDDSDGTLDTGYIGARAFNGGADNKYTGKIDDIRYYQLALSAGQVSFLYSGGNGTEENHSASGEVLSTPTGNIAKVLSVTK